MANSFLKFLRIFGEVDPDLVEKIALWQFIVPSKRGRKTCHHPGIAAVFTIQVADILRLCPAIFSYPLINK